MPPVKLAPKLRAAPAGGQTPAPAPAPRPLRHTDTGSRAPVAPDASAADASSVATATPATSTTSVAAPRHLPVPPAVVGLPVPVRPVRPAPPPRAPLALEPQAELRPHAEFTRAVPAAFARTHRIVGLEPGHGSPGSRPVIAMVDPADLPHADNAARRAGWGIDYEPRGVDADRLRVLHHELYDKGGAGQAGTPGAAVGMDAVVASLGRDAEADERAAVLADLEHAAREDLLGGADSGPVVRLVNLALSEAVAARASDVHFQPTEDDLTLRMRVDGVLYDTFQLPKKVQEEVISRVKVMARMDIAEKRLPQDGRVAVQIGDLAVDLRVSTLPTAFGERVVVRLLDKSRGLMTLDDLGMASSLQDRFRALVRREHGIVLVTGPTGSGKTTTLYAGLQSVDAGERNILTVEDPIEYQLAGVSQTQVNTKKGMTFASGLRSILRQDPDLIMVGEIRDRETAEIAIQSALTGHLVLSTLHTNHAAAAVARLLDLGVEPFLVASSLNAVLAQRLVRRICGNCVQPDRPDDAQLVAAGIDPASEGVAQLRRGAGCEACRGTGYRGRVGVYELLPVDNQVRELIKNRADAAAVHQSAVSRGMTDLNADARSHVLAGRTTVAELLRFNARHAD